MEMRPESERSDQAFRPVHSRTVTENDDVSGAVRTIAGEALVPLYQTVREPSRMIPKSPEALTVAPSTATEFAVPSSVIW